MCGVNMNKLLCSLAFVLGVSSSSIVLAEDMLDSSAVERIVSLQKSSSLNLNNLKGKYLIGDSGGLQILRSRFQKPENILLATSNLGSQAWTNIENCANEFESLNKQALKIRSQLSSLSKVSLDDVKVYAVVGAGNTAATASPSGVVLALEMICQSKLPFDDIRKVLTSYIAHELVHVLQYRLTTRKSFDFNLLEISLLEGSADFMAELILEDDYVLDDERVAYGENHRSTLVKDFKPNMLTKDYRPWLYTPVSSMEKAMPMDMGYWIGYLISKNFIGEGKEIRELLTLSDAESVANVSKIFD
jgi:hypothetical protein